MNATLAVSDLVRRFEREDSPGCGGQQPARRALARRLGVAPGTLKSAREGRLKRICVEFFAALKAEEMRRLDVAIRKAEHDLGLARQIGLRPDDAAVLRLEARLAEARGHARAGAP